MLESLHIRNLAVVGDANVEFGPGFNVLTGETGAGKSLILGAFQLLLGERAGPHLIRTGEDHSELTAIVSLTTFTDEASARLRDILDNAGVSECDTEELLLRRVLSRGGSRAFVNSVPVTLAVLRQLGELLVDIHGPHDHQSLLRPACQLGLLDRSAGLASVADACAQAWDRLRASRDALDKAQARQQSPEGISLLRSQLVEIQTAEISVDADESLFARYQAAANARRLLEIAGQARSILAEAEDAVPERLAVAVRLLDEARDLDPDGAAPLCSRIEQVVTDVRELALEMGRYADRLDIDPVELARMEERLELLHRLKRKYGGSLDAVLEHAETVQTELAETEDHEALEARRREEVEKARRHYDEVCRTMTSRRRSAAEKLGKAITAKLRRLAFKQARFEVAVSDAEPGPRGSDHVEFCFAPGAGVDLLPLRRIASTGEIARIMLAIKTVLCGADQVPILVFDEVDANVGGRVAVIVGEELRAVAARHQVLCITHLPQIAAAADRHFLVRKADEPGALASAQLSFLDKAARVAEIARMLGAPADSRTALAHARELVRRTDAVKQA